MKILISGGAGFVGTNIVHAWLKKHPKYSFFIVDNFSQGNRETFETFLSSNRLELKQIDLRNKRELKEYFDSIQPDIVINAVDGTRNEEYLEINVFATQNLLEAAHSTSVSRFIQLSCGEVYGTNDPSAVSEHAHRLLNERDTLSPGSPQQASKAAADLLAWSYYHRYNLPVTIVRPALLFGPYQSPDRFVPLVITHALKNQTFPVSNNDLAIRDLLHVDDLISALDLVIHDKSTIGEIYNVSAGIRMRTKEIAELILTLLDRSKNLMYVSTEDDRVLVNGLDSTKIQNTLGWKAKKTPDIHACLEETINWFKNNQDWWKS